MSEKFMKVKRIVAPAVCVMLAVMQLTGCGVATSEELVNMLSSGEQIEINIELPENAEELKGTPVEWKELSYLTDQEDLRKEIDNALGIIAYGESKNGVLYVNPETEEWEPNNTIEAVFKNKAYREVMKDEDVVEEISKAVLENYVDLDETSDGSVVQLAALNAYFNLFPADEETASFNGNDYLTRAQFMSGLAKAHLQAQDGATASAETVEQVGDNEYSLYAELMSDSAYLDITSKSLNEKNVNGLITRAEVAYMIVNTYYADEFKSVDVTTKPSTYSDVKNAGDMAGEAETTGKDQYKAANLSYMINNPSKGMDESLYKAMVVAYAHNIFGSETESRWSEPITKVEALQLLKRVYESADTTVKCQNGKNQTVDLADADLDNLDDDLTYEINGKSYKAEDIENSGTVILLQTFGKFPPMTYLEWTKQVEKINNAKYEIYKNHLVIDKQYDEHSQYSRLTNEQLLWLERMDVAMTNGMTDVQKMIDDGLVLSEEEVDESLDYLYFDGRLSDEEKVAYEEIYGISKPEITYKRPSNGSSSNSSYISGSSSNDANVSSDTASNESSQTDESSADTGASDYIPNETTNDGGSSDVTDVDGWKSQGGDFGNPNADLSNAISGSVHGL